MKRFSLLRCTLGLFFLCAFSSWGFLVHRTVNQLAIYQLPGDLRSFFYSHKDYLVKHSVRPDERRNTDKTEDPKHFIDAEPYGDSSLWKLPHDWQQAVALYTKDTLEKYGYVPYVVMHVKAQLTEAMRTGKKDSILYYAADLGHYIADAHVPLHTTVNYDGQLSGQKGLHSLWESTIPELELTNYNLYNSHKARYLKNANEAIWAACRSGFALLPDMFEQERSVSNDFADSTKYRIQVRNGRESKRYSTAFARAYSLRLGNTVNEQLLRSAQLIADFWYTAWVDAGKPKLKALLQTPMADSVKSSLRTELKAYKKNELLQKNLLLAKQEKESKE